MSKFLTVALSASFLLASQAAISLENAFIDSGRLNVTSRIPGSRRSISTAASPIGADRNRAGHWLQHLCKNAVAPNAVMRRVGGTVDKSVP